jgi:hypothetical protein
MKTFKNYLEYLEEGAGNLSPDITEKLTKHLKKFHGPDSKIKFKNKGQYVHVKSREQSEYDDDAYDHHTHVYEINHTPEGKIKLNLRSHSQIEESFKIDESDSGIAAKAAKSGISIDTLRKVYNRGMAAWNSGHRPGTTPQQWAMARVNSYISHGSGTYGGADKDLHEEWSQKYKKSINCAHPKGFSQKAHCAGKKKQNESVEYEMLCPDCGISEGDTSKLPRVTKDKESGLPKKYVAGLSDATAKARAAHWEKMSKLSDSNPAAYAPAPGDATAKTKESKYTKKYHAMYGESMDEEDIGKHNNATTGFKPLVDKLTPKYGKEVAGKIAGSIKKKVIAKEEVDAQFDLIEEVVQELAFINNVDPEILWEQLESLTDEELLEYAVDAKGYKSSTGGLTQKGRDAYNSKGAHLKAPVTTSPSKLKAGSKASNRRKSFCARMSGVQGPMKKPNGEPTRKALALRKWNC